MLSKLLMQLSVYGWSCVPSLLFTRGQTMVEAMKIMVTSLKRSDACTATVHAMLGDETLGDDNSEIRIR